jgi:outer membrane protein assembly factor BamB
MFGASAESIPDRLLATIPAVIINPTVGPPTTNVLVSGTGFDPYVAVDIYFDVTDLALAVTNGAGVFGVAASSSGLGGISLQVPASAVPGTHWITAVERYGQKAAQKSFLVRTDWAQFRFEPRHRGMNPYENVLSPDTVGSIDLHWKYTTRATVISSPAVANGVVYFGSIDTNFYALNAGTGALLWSTSGGIYFFSSSPAVANGVVYVGAYRGSGLGRLYALNASTGALLWKYTTGAEVYSSPAVTNGVVYFGSDDGNLYALNAGTGTLLWNYSTGYKIDSSPAVANGVVYFGANNGDVYAINATTGALMWVYTTGSAVRSSPAVANGVVYVGSDWPDTNLYALNASTGALMWKYTTGGSIGSSPAVANGVVYFGSSYPDDTFYALNASTGALMWKYITGSYIQGSSPAVANGVVYVGADDGNLYAFDLTGGLLSKKFSPPSRPDPSLLVPDLKLKPSTPVTRMPSD